MVKEIRETAKGVVSATEEQLHKEENSAPAQR